MDGIFAFKECVLRLFCQHSKKLKKNEIINVGYYTQAPPSGDTMPCNCPSVLMSSVISIQVGACLEKIRVTE